MSNLDRVAYKPLGTAPSSSLEVDEGDEDQTNSHSLRYHGGNGFHHFRILLYILAAFLFIIFLAQFANNERPKPQHLRSIPTQLQSLNVMESEFKTTFYPKTHQGRSGGVKDYDDLRYNSNSSTIDRWWRLGTRDKYVTVTNYIRAMKSFSYNASVTLTTQATSEFMYHTLELCKRWDGPISVAVFCPGTEMTVAVTLIKFMRQCLPKPLSACIQDKVTWHLVYNNEHGPEPYSLSHPAKHLDQVNHPLFANQDVCPKFLGPEPSDSIRQFEEQLKKNSIDFRQKHKLLYPINVLRNTARLAATTKYVLASDIELYPSINLVPHFIQYTKHNDVAKKIIFTLPIFEVKPNVTVPKTKKELVSLFERGDAVFFHKWVCDWCQNFPNRIDWLQTDKFGYENYHEEANEIAIFERTQRDKSRNSWEPIYIGTNEDPLYDDRLTWEGRRDKMGQMFEMCLRDYQLFVLGNAFLVHAPGIKLIDEGDNKRRLKFMISNNAIYDETVEKLRLHYANSSTINKC